MGEFLEARNKFDPEGQFLNEHYAKVLNIRIDPATPGSRNSKLRTPSTWSSDSTSMKHIPSDALPVNTRPSSAQHTAKLQRVRTCFFSDVSHSDSGKDSGQNVYNP